MNRELLSKTHTRRATLVAALLVATPFAASRADSSDDAAVARGKYLVTVAVCNDCHTPVKMGPNGPEPDMSRMLSGHPQDLDMVGAPTLADPWGIAAAAVGTAWSGPWTSPRPNPVMLRHMAHPPSPGRVGDGGRELRPSSPRPPRARAPAPSPEASGRGAASPS